MRKKRRVRAIEVTRLDDLKGLLTEGKPILVDLWKANCQACRMMTGIVDELAAEFDGRAHVVKVDVGRVRGAIEAFQVRSTPTFVVLAKPPKSLSKKARQRAGEAHAAAAPSLNPRWRVSGLVRKDILAGVLRSNGAGDDR